MKKRELNGKEFERHGFGFLALGVMWAFMGMLPMGMVFGVIGIEEIVRGRRKTKRLKVRENKGKEHHHEIYR